MAHVDTVLAEIGADEVPTLIVFNKIDALPMAEPRIDRDAEGNPLRVWLSARDGQGIDLLKQAIAELLAVDVFSETLYLSSKYGRLRAMLFEHGAVKSERFDETGRFVLDVKLPKKDYLQILARAGMSEDQIEAV
jgi:GTP-binding protein HflX